MWFLVCSLEVLKEKVFDILYFVLFIDFLDYLILCILEYMFKMFVGENVILCYIFFLLIY